MRKIRNQNERLEKRGSVIVRRTIDTEKLGREVYADQVETPYSVYLIRDLYLAKDYQNLAEGEAYFDAICDSWDNHEHFEPFVVRCIFFYVETEMMRYTLLIGSQEPFTQEEGEQLQHWLASVAVDPLALAHTQSQAQENQTVRYQIIEAYNEIDELRKMILELTEALEQTKKNHRVNASVISKNVRKMYLRRETPVILEEKELAQLPQNPEQEERSRRQRRAFRRMAQRIRKNQREKKQAAKKQKEQLAAQKRTARKPIPLPLKQKPHHFLKETTDRQVPKNWVAFSQVLHHSRKKEGVSKNPMLPEEAKQMEERIYRCFMVKRVRGSEQKNRGSKRKINRQELLNRIEKAEQLNYLWQKFYRQRKEDVIINGRLSCNHLVEHLFDFLTEIKEVAYTHTFFNRNTAVCPVELLRKLDGYVLLNLYIRKLSAQPKKT